MNSLPTGIQDFATLRENGNVYVDKTPLIAKMLKTGRSFFLSRPRRFGKSLLVSTIKAIFEGRKDLFKGLWLEDNCDFAVHPVIRIDFSFVNFTDKSLDQGIVDWLRFVALEHGYALQGSNARDAFRELILEFSKTARVVVLVDEYDKALTDYLLEPEKLAANKSVLRSLYGVLKPLNEHLEFVFLTGVSKIGKLSLFSDLNNLVDISLAPEFATLCGYSRPEIEQYFPDYIQAVAEYQKLEPEPLWEQIKHWYNGYSWDGINRLYCPFSFLCFLGIKSFKSYWYETGTPTFLLDLIRAAQLNPLEFEYTELADWEMVATNVDRMNPTSLMFQTGYLTILEQSSGAFGVAYTLGYPNQEVRMAFSNDLILEYSHSTKPFPESFNLKLYRALEKLDWETFFAIVNRVLSSIPYEIFQRQEAYPHSLLHIMLLATGFKTTSQVETSLGRIDILLETYTHRIIFELKTKGTPEEALAQINKQGYADGLEPPVVRVGVVFSLEQKIFSAWQVG